MSDAKPSEARRHWIFCSSGARPLYLENVVRALALPRGESITFRYEESLVSPKFRRAAEGNSSSPNPLIGDTAYLCYLDNRHQSKPTTIYPVREATITEVAILGTTYVVTMKLQCFISWDVDPTLDQTIAKLAIDRLPTWIVKRRGISKRFTPGGYWLAETKRLPTRTLVWYSAEHRTHLKAFESAVRSISRGADFSRSKRLFATILGIYDLRKKTWLGGEALRAGGLYELKLYHFLPSKRPSAPLEDFRLEASSDNDDVMVVGNAERHVEANYDEVPFVFRVGDDARDGTVNLQINIKRLDSGAAEPTFVLRGAVRRRVASAKIRKLIVGAVIGAGLFGTQAVTLVATGKATLLTGLLALAFSTLAGMGAAFQFKTRI